MAEFKKEFVFSDEVEPHIGRTRAILKEHPEVKKLIGKNPHTIWIILFLVIGQMTIAGFLAGQPWWLVFLAAYFVGAFFDHAMFVMIHECAHNLLFKKPWANTLAGIISNIPQIFPSSVSFQKYHLKHHAFQGVHELDADLPGNYEAWIVHNSTFKKALWLLFYPFVQISRTMRLKEIKMVDGWIVFNWLVQIATVAVVVYLWGAQSLVYLIASLFFSIGLHPLGARWIQEHYLTLDPGQETYSYYGGWNKIAMNVGYHNEHHDFPSVPWNKLPSLKNLASEYYDTLKSHNSWTKLFFFFLFSDKVSLYSRVIRANRGKIKVTQDKKYVPDQAESKGEKVLVA
ncbi:MAG: fatty acid desaturase [Cyclobacteriaceae bacterium]